MESGSYPIITALCSDFIVPYRLNFVNINKETIAYKLIGLTSIITLLK